MNNNINIAEILKDYPKGTKLYSPLFGEVALEEVDTECTALIKIKYNANIYTKFFKTGLYYNYEGAECLLFPSSEMRDWSKFAWKKGDLLVNSCGFQCIFKEWASNDYTKFNGCYSNSRDGYEDISNARTDKFDKLDSNVAYRYIREIERKLGGKLNLEILEIEKTQSEFKGGDIVTQSVLKGVNVCIIKNCIDKIDNKYNYYARYNTQDKKINYDDWSHISPFTKFATDSEKQQLFEALAKEGKAWDAEKKQIVDLKPKYELKPFDKVLVKDEYYGSWKPAFFWKKVDLEDLHSYMVIGGKRYRYCEPYEGNENLLDY
jgi:hypothetical protein